jgi:hypothetical protein
MLQTLSIRHSIWTQFLSNRSTLSCKDIISCIQLLAVQLAIDAHPYFLDHHNQIVKAIEPTWQKCREEDRGQFYHFTVHLEGANAYAIDFLEHRTEEWPYGVRICGLDKH